MNANTSTPGQNPGPEIQYSTAPDGERFALPTLQDEAAEIRRLQALVADHRALGREIVVVMGVGFVGAVMAGIIADSTQKETGENDPNSQNLESSPPISALDISGNRAGIDTMALLIEQVPTQNANLQDLTPNKFVIGMQRPSVRSYWKIPTLNRGIAPVEAEDPEVAPLIARCVNEKKTLTATYTYEALTFADVVVVDVQCDYFKEDLGNCRTGHAEIAALEESLKVIAERIPPECLVLIETTVPPGTTEYVAYPIMKKAFERRFGRHDKETGGHDPETGGHDPNSQNSGSYPSISGHKAIDENSVSYPPNTPKTCPEPLLAHSYERVMPGRNYVASIRDFWRVCSGINAEARDRVVKFLSEILNVEKFPLTVLDRPIESETSKIVENSYRATILAFLNEWSLFAERNGVDLVKVIQAIKVRPTHSNMIFPGPGIGGYCLPKDGGLGVWAYQTLMGFEDDIFKMTPLAIDINDTRALHAAELVRDALRNMGKIVAASKVVILGASYREDVGDTRYSGSETIVRKLAEMGAEIGVHDPYVKHWWELEKQESYPAPGHSWARFFRNQQGLSELRIEQDVASALKGADSVVFAVRHDAYMKLTPDDVIGMTGRPVAVIDCFGILDDAAIRRYFELGCEVKGLGRGHVKRIKDAVKK